MSIVHISEDLIQEFTIDSEGKATVTIRGAARLLDIASQTLDDACRASLKPSKLAEKLIESGFNPASLAVVGIPDVAFALMVEYYAFDAQRKPEQAKNLCRSFLAIGIRTWIQKELDYQPQQQSQSPLRLGDIPKPPIRHRKPISVDSQIGDCLVLLAKPGIEIEDAMENGNGEYLQSYDFDFSEAKMIDVQRFFLKIARDMEYVDLAIFPRDRTGFHCPDQDIPGGLLTEDVRVGAIKMAGDKQARLAGSQRFADKQKSKKKGFGKK
jgi:hypothetical protein